jgi:N-acetylglucosamine-6-sulfatase
VPSLDRRQFLALSGSTLALRFTGQVPRNLIVVLTDDQRWDALGCCGHPFLRTPHLDRLAAGGARCRNAFVTTALCSPSRATILSGLYAHSHGVLDNETPFPDTLPTYPKLLTAAGYTTAYVGKWHMGGASDEPRPGWQHWVSFRGQGPYVDPTFNTNGERQKVTGYTTDLITERALDFLRNRPRARPFCLAIGHKAVHSPFRPAPRHATAYTEAPLRSPMPDDDANYQGLPRWVRAQRNSFHGVDGMYDKAVAWEDFYRNYHRTLLAVDDGIGRLLEVLKELDLLASTLLVFTSDNGFLHGEKGLIDKRCFYEPSIRVPLLAHCPDLIAPGTLVDSMILNVDLPSLLLDAAGLVPPDSMQGRSYLPLLRGEKVPWRTSWLYEYFFERSFPQTPTVLGVRTETHKLAVYHGIWDRNELYDLAKDPLEEHNLIDDAAQAERRKELLAELHRLRTELGCRFDPAWK